MAGGLKKSNVLGVGVDYIHGLEIDVPAAQPLPDMPGDHQIASHRDRGTVNQEECVAQAGIQIRLHDQIGRLAIRQPDAANRGHGSAHHHRMANVSHRRRRQQQDDDQRPDSEPDHRDPVQDPGGERHHGGNSDYGRTEFLPGCGAAGKT